MEDTLRVSELTIGILLRRLLPPSNCPLPVPMYFSNCCSRRAMYGSCPASAFCSSQISCQQAEGNVVLRYGDYCKGKTLKTKGAPVGAHPHPLENSAPRHKRKIYAVFMISWKESVAMNRQTCGYIDQSVNGQVILRIKLEGNH